MSYAPSLSNLDRQVSRVPANSPNGSDRFVSLPGASTNTVHASQMVVPNGTTSESVLIGQLPHLVASTFAKLAATWRESTSHLSRVQLMVADSNYLAIAAMGREVVPLILRDLDENGGYWYPLLEVLTKERPETSQERKSRAGMKLAWLRWGRSHGYVA